MCILCLFLCFSVQWSSSLRDGIGVYRFEDGVASAAGGWVNGERKGPGVWTLADGSTHMGMWERNVAEGFGARFAADGSLIAQGYFQAGVLIGAQKPADWTQVIGGLAAAAAACSPSSPSSTSSPSALPSPTGAVAGSAAAAALGRQASAAALQLGPTPGETQFTINKPGRTYVGELKEGRQSGYGIATFKSGASYRGTTLKQRVIDGLSAGDAAACPLLKCSCACLVCLL